MSIVHTSSVARCGGEVVWLQGIAPYEHVFGEERHRYREYCAKVPRDYVLPWRQHNWFTA